MPTCHTSRSKSVSRMLSMWFALFIGLAMALAAPAHAAVTSGIIGFGSGAAPGAFQDVASDYNGLRFTGQWSYFAELDLRAGTPGITTSGDAITSTTLDGNAIIKAANGTDRFSLARVSIHAYGSMSQFTFTGYRGGSPVSGASLIVTKTLPMTKQFVPIDLSALADVDEVRVSNNATLNEGGNFAFDDLAVDPFPPAAPTATSLSPTSGLAAGGYSVTITGANFTNVIGSSIVTAVSFGGAPATSFTVNSSTQITAIAPAGSGTVNVTVTTAGGTSVTAAANQFTYIPAPTVTSISPNFGPQAGGTSVTITGTNLSGATAVTFGGTPATGYTVDSATQITATSPAGTGPVDVRVTTAGGTSAISGVDQFSYLATPTITSIAPTAGPQAGGTAVTITGTNFIGTTGVNFGVSAATGFTVDSATSITATAPPGTGTVDIRVSNTVGTSPAVGADQFTYVAAPSVTSISPTAGPTGGGTTVTITGTGFSAALPTGAVRFGGTIATYTINSNTQITATAPAGSAGTVDVTVTTVGGTSATSAADQYTYVPAPTVTAVSPASGSSLGGSTVTLTGTNFTGATAVTFGSTAATGFTVNSATQITAIAPAGSAGTVNVRVTTAGGTSATGAADQFTYVAITVTPATLAGTPKVGVSFSETLTASGGATPYTFAMAGGSTLPAGLSLSSAGVISGTPTAAGPFSFTVQATDNSSISGQRAYSGSVAAAAVVLTPAASTLPAARLNTAYAGQTFTASGGTAPYTYASSGTLPTGMTFNASTGVLGGTPTAAGSFTFTITATDSSTGTGAPFTSGNTSYTLVVNSTNADLSALALSSGTLAPGFGAGTLAYTATVPNASSTITVTATAADSGATILVNGAAATTPVALNVGSNTVSIEVTAQDGTTKKTYVVTVTREAKQSASGSGVDLGIANSSPTCTLTAANFISPSAVAGSLGPLPAAFTYPQAAVDFTAKQCAPSSTLTVTLTFTSPVPANAQLMKYDATATPKWQPFTPTISGNQVSYTIVDGGLRDDDKTVNGEFVDPVILAVPAPPSAQSIPTLDRWGLLLLSLMAGAAGFMGMARRQRTGR